MRSSAGAPGTPKPEPEPEAIVAFGPLARHLARTAGALGALAFVGLVAQGVGQGLTFRLMGAWAAAWLLSFALVSAALAAAHALGGAGRAQRRGERLASSDVGLRPRREPPSDDP